MRIHAMTTDRGGCFEHRIALPLAHLGRRGHETTYGNGVSAAVLNELAARPDSVLIAKFVTEDAAVDAWEQIAAAPKRPALMVYDVDDSYYHVGDIYTGDRSIYAKPETIARSERMMKAADLVTCTTLQLAALYAPLGTPVAVLPNAVADEILDWHLRTPPRRFTVGYQGSPSHLHDMQYWVGAFDQFMRRTNAMWHWFGIHDPKCWPADRQRVTTWTNDPESFHRSLNGKFHVGVAPLHPELEFNRYKSGLKAQVYAALGRPTVASDFPFYRDTIVQGQTGFLCEDSAEWNDALECLYRDPHRATVMGMNARELESTRTMSKVVHRWEDAYREALP